MDTPRQLLTKNGIYKKNIILPEMAEELIKSRDWQELDVLFASMLKKGSELYEILNEISPIKNITHMLAIRQAPDEDGIWHDDGSRELGFSISLCLPNQRITGGGFCLRKKGEKLYQEFPVGEFGEFTCFLTGKAGFEHRVTAVTAGVRTMLVGWLNDSYLD